MVITKPGLPRAPENLKRLLSDSALVENVAVLIGQGPITVALSDALAACGAKVVTRLPSTGEEAADLVSDLSPDVLVSVGQELEPRRAEDLHPRDVAAEAERHFSVPYNAMLGLARSRRDRGASIIAVTSNVAYTAAPGYAATAAAQGALYTAARVLAAEWAPRDIRVNSVSMGPFHPVRAESSAARVPAQRLGELRELAWLVTYIASPYAAYMTGSHISIDGGDSLRRRLVGEIYEPDEFLYA